MSNWKEPTEDSFNGTILAEVTFGGCEIQPACTALTTTRVSNRRPRKLAKSQSGAWTDPRYQKEYIGLFMKQMFGMEL